jgi:RimJ/RimL family protein N-acetyltransferase
MSPLVLHGDEILLRPARFRDRAKWNEVRAENKEWLTPWEATLPKVPAGTPASEFVSKRPSFFEMVHALNREARAGRSYSFLIWKDENLIGQITLGGVIYGAYVRAILAIGSIEISLIAVTQPKQYNFSHLMDSQNWDYIGLKSMSA